ncbi:type IV secretion system protein TraC [Candidatus Odyssella thessalonicensis]|uniref:type IV secretion system protein TraC n=1 Tax=Candidatus Odyssella thessalonicensis TaxID=84647 RepID=UPI000225B986|nr:type IV secretion system protein TraC [Candidatus Odyssella thessalonicensis]
MINQIEINKYLQYMADMPRLHQLLPYESYDPVTELFYNEESTGFVLISHPVVGASLDDQGRLAQFFKQERNLPEGSSLQFLLFASPAIAPHLNFWQFARKGEVFQKLAQSRRGFLEAKAYQDEAGLLIRDYRLLISYTVPGHHKDFDSQQKLMMIREELEAILSQVGIQALRVDAQTLITEVGTLLNLKDSTHPYYAQWNEFDSLSKQIIDLDKNFIKQADGVYLNDGQTVCRSYIPHISPKYWSLGSMDLFLGNIFEKKQQISCPFLIHYGLFVEYDQAVSKSRVLAKRESLEKSLVGGMSKFTPNLKDQYEEIVELSDQVNQGERFILSTLNFTLFSPVDEIARNEQALATIWQSNGWSFQPTRYDHDALLLSSLPMMWTLGEKSSGLKKQGYGFGTALATYKKAKRTITKESQNMLPLIGEWKGQSTPGMPLVGPRGQLFFWNPFCKLLLPGGGNVQLDHDSNMSCAGQPGSGKSVCLNEIMATILGVGGRAFVLDMGRSFKKTCQFLEGQHLEFDIRYPQSLNPFTSIPTDDPKDMEAMLGCVVPLFQVMAAPKQGTTDLENSYLDQAVRWSWEKYGPHSSVDTVREYLNSREEITAKNLAQVLFPFSSQGSYGHFFNGPATVNLKNRLVVIETDDLRNFPSLMAVIVQLLIIQINQEMAKGDRVTPFVIVIDEAWMLLSGKSTAQFISAASRTSRKYRGSIITATQQLTDYFKEEAPGATEAFNCSAWKCILNQKDDVITAMKHHPQLQEFVDTEYKEALLRSIRSRPPYYSEMVIFGPGIKGVVGRLRLDAFSRLLFSTNPEEFQMIESYLTQGSTISEAIEMVMSYQSKRPLASARGYGYAA